MMSAQMLAVATSGSGTVADLAPGAKDGMRMLEAKAAEMSAVSAAAVEIGTYGRVIGFCSGGAPLSNRVSFLFWM